jgi:large-conductance mechanosensitive channel
MYEIYEQVVLTCTIINLIIVATFVTCMIISKVQDRREKKRRNQDKQ